MASAAITALSVSDVSKQFGGLVAVDHVSFELGENEVLGLIGPNGVGKTTLLKILLGEMPPQSGEVMLGTKLTVAYFDQLRSALLPEKSVAENVVQGSDTIDINGNKRHIISYLGDFLFTPERARTPVKALSGGECNRLLLARLFSMPTNLLVLDEPTNDLDIETLELLEELLCSYQGTLLIVSHDRTFLDNVVTSTFIFSGDGKIQEYVGGYHDWLRQRQVEDTQKKAPSKVIEKPVKVTVKLSYNEQRELSQLPQKIEALEKEHAALEVLTANPEFYQQASDEIAKTMEKMERLARELEQTYERWAELDGKKPN